MPIATPPTLHDIELRAQRYAQAREKVAAIVGALNEAIEALKRSELPKLRRAVAGAAEAHDALKALIEAAPELFVKPKTVTFHGIRAGYVKGRGGIEWDDPDAVVAAIQRHYPEQAEQLIRWTARPLKEAINQLDAGALRKLGCRVVDTGEEVFIKAVDSAVDKMVDALLKDATEEAGA